MCRTGAPLFITCTESLARHSVAIVVVILPRLLLPIAWKLFSSNPHVPLLGILGYNANGGSGRNPLDIHWKCRINILRIFPIIIVRRKYIRSIVCVYLHEQSCFAQQQEFIIPMFTFETSEHKSNVTALLVEGMPPHSDLVIYHINIFSNSY